MAEGDATAYNNFLEQLLNGAVDLVGDTINIALIGSGYAFDRTGNPGYATISGDEITATGYTAKGKSLAGKTTVQNDTAHNVKYDANDLTWTSLAATTIAHAIMFDDTVTAPVADILLVRWEIGTNSNGGDYKLAFNAAGVLILS
jgi:hypothetical protein